MSKVIKNDDGVVVVEGTPAAKLVKDSDKFFASKPPERMAGESISQPKRIDPRAINTKTPIAEKKESFLDFYKKQSSPIFDGKGNVIGYKDGSSSTTEMFDKPIPREEYEGLGSDKSTNDKKPVEDKIRYTGGSKDFNEKTGTVVKRKDAKEKAESRRERFFERRRSKKEAERSQKEQEATKGRFITTLRR